MNSPIDSSPAPVAARVQIGPGSAGEPPESGAGGADDEFWALTTDAGRRLLAEVAAVRSIRPADLARLRKLAPPGAVAAAIRLTLARRKAAAKFERGARM